MKRGTGRLSRDSDEERKTARTEPQIPKADRSFTRDPQATTTYKTRPASVAESKKGSSGTPVMLQTNYFHLQKVPGWTLYQYRVDFVPEVLDMRVRKSLIGQLRPKFGCGQLFDGTMLFLTKELQMDDGKVVFEAKSKQEDIYNVEIKFASTIPVGSNMSRQVHNLVLRRAMQSLDMQLVQRNYFDAGAKISVRNQFNVELWPGYTTSIRQHETDILICSDVTHKVMRTETIYDLMKKIRDESPDFRTAIQSAFLGQIVLTDYNNRTYRIDDVDFSRNPSKTFETKDGEITYVDYYRTRYNIHIKDVNQPLLVSNAKARDIRGGSEECILLIPELCRATGLTDAMRANFHFMKSMDVHTRIDPPSRIRKLHEFNQRLKMCAGAVAVFDDWQTKLGTNLVEVPARKLNNEQMLWGGDNSTTTKETADWTSDLRNHSSFRAMKLQNWFLIVPERVQREANEFLNQLIRAAGGLRFDLARPKIFPIRNDQVSEYVKALEECATRDPQAQMIVCVTPNDNADRYAAIKKKCCIERPMLTQTIVQRTITPKGGNVSGLLSIATKVAIQMNCKLGGAPWNVNIPLRDVLIIGIDISTDSRDKRRVYSVLVGMMDMKEPKYISAVSQQSSSDEVSNQLPMNVIKILRAYQEVHKALPTRVCIYRSGVGDGQIQYIVENEVKLVAEALDSIYAQAELGPKCRMCYILVNTRINSRFFAKGKNPAPGTVIDDVVTLPERYDFYLVPQSVRQGTVSATNYNVVYDEFGLPPDKLQLLTYKLCHIYYNWSGTVRVPAVCKYASKLAFLVAQHLHQAPHKALEKQLFFL